MSLGPRCYAHFVTQRNDCLAVALAELAAGLRKMEAVALAAVSRLLKQVGYAQ